MSVQNNLTKLRRTTATPHPKGVLVGKMFSLPLIVSRQPKANGTQKFEDWSPGQHSSTMRRCGGNVLQGSDVCPALRTTASPSLRPNWERPCAKLRRQRVDLRSFHKRTQLEKKLGLLNEENKANERRDYSSSAGRAKKKKRNHARFALSRNGYFTSARQGTSGWGKIMKKSDIVATATNRVERPIFGALVNQNTDQGESSSKAVLAGCTN